MTQVLLVGAGIMAQSYAKVLQAQAVQTIVVGRGDASAAAFKESTGMDVVTGGLARFLAQNRSLPDAAIIAVGVDELARSTEALLQRGIRRILVEKPAGLDAAEVGALAALAAARQAQVYVGYNRRFYASTRAARDIIAADGGVTSFNFEFTEWSHVIEPLSVPQIVKERWFLANSTHVVDLAFFLGGKPREMSSYVAGALAWHQAAAVFAGAGVTHAGALFSYQANWAAPGRWSVEMLTRAHRLIFRPMEQLHIQQIGSVAVNKVDIADHLDTAFKPGVYLQVEAFLSPSPPPDLLTIADQLLNAELVYARIAPPNG